MEVDGQGVRHGTGHMTATMETHIQTIVHSHGIYKSSMVITALPFVAVEVFIFNEFVSSG